MIEVNVNFAFSGIQSGLMLSAVAMCTVFFLIAMLMLSMMLLHKLCSKQKQTSKTHENKYENINENADDKLIAVITAAVTQFSKRRVKVLNICPVAMSAPKPSVWRNAARVQNFEKR